MEESNNDNGYKIGGRFKRQLSSRVAGAIVAGVMIIR
jgi:hypothetical protein